MAAGTGQERNSLDNRKKKLLRRAGFLIAFLIGLFIAIYPAVSSRWNAMRSDRLLDGYREQAADDSRAEEYARSILEAQAYNETLHVPSVPDAFSIRDGVQEEAYEALLNVDGNGLMGSVEIPVIGVELPLYHYTTEEVLLQGAGHLLGSALPVGGDRTHCVVSAHRGLPNAEMFSELNLMETGDRFYFHILNETFAYETDQILEVLPHEVESLSAVEGEDLATLVTCTPYGINTHRLLVRGHRIPFSEEVLAADHEAQVRTDPNRLFYQILSALAGIAIAAVLVGLRTFVDKRLKKKGREG